MTKDQPEGYLGSLQTDAERARQQYVKGEIDEDELEKELDFERVLREDRERSRRQRRAKRQWFFLAVMAVLIGALLMLLTSGGQNVPL